MTPPDAQREPLRAEYSALAHQYERRWRRYVETTTRRTLARLALVPGETLVDVGCGTGALLRAASSSVRDVRVVGLDLVPAMLREARRAAGTVPPWAQPPRLAAADSAALPLPDGVADAAATVSSLHYWSDAAAAAAELRRIVRPGGRVVVTDWCGDSLTTRLLAGWLRLRGRPLARVWTVGSGTELLAGAGLRVVHAERYRAGVSWGLMTLVATVPGK